MASTSIIPGADLPARPPRAAQLAAVRARARASESVVNLLCALAYGEREDDWAPNAFGLPLPTTVVREAIHA